MGARAFLANADRGALISECQRFRYWLWRRWAHAQSLLFVMLNPSTADANVDDATIRRCATFAATHGFGAIGVVNLFAFRATKPADLRAAGWPTGEENDYYIDCAAGEASAICVAWGAIGERGPANDRVQVVMPILRRAGKPIQCLNVTRSGYPQHPLYLSSACRLHSFDETAVQEAMHG